MKVVVDVKETEIGGLLRRYGNLKLLEGKAPMVIRRKVHVKANKSNIRWTKANDRTLEKAVAKGLSQKDIAKKLKRTVSSIAFRKRNLGLNKRR